jgi:ATPase subunit of ABC transporter with duplicated ATPase domains
MSLGTRKKMMLCAAWIGAPRVLLLDEPGNGLDLASRDHPIRLVRHTVSHLHFLDTTIPEQITQRQRGDVGGQPKTRAAAAMDFSGRRS